TFDEVKTGEYADFLSNVDRPLTVDERNILQMEVNRIYDTFVQRVADGRGLSKSTVDSIGQGRVWSGRQALANGLVDRLGNIQDAVDVAARKAGLEQYRFVYDSTVASPFDSFLGASSDRISTWLSQRELGEYYRYYRDLKSGLQLRGIQARLPFTLEIH